MATECLKPFRGKVMRVTKLDACGAPVEGTTSTVVSDGFVSIEQRAVFRDPDEYEVVNANGALCLNERSQAQLKWIELTINLCSVDPEMINIMTGSPLVLDDTPVTPNTVGFRTRENVAGYFALEAWTDLGGQPCSGGVTKYGYILLPFIVDGVLGDITLENGPVSFSVTQARTKNNSPWGTGPYNVRIEQDGTPADAPLLTAINALDHRHIQMTTLAPPTSACGAVALVIP